MNLSGVDSNKTFLVPLSEMVNKISSVIFQVESVSVEATGEILVINKTGTGKVIFYKDNDYKKVWSTLVSAIDTDPLKSKLVTSKDELEYLDVRYGNSSVNGILGNHATTTQEVSEASSSAIR
jgi:hypothetical protein